MTKPSLNGKSATLRVFDFIGNVHDIEAFQGIQSSLELNNYIFVTHWGHLAVIFLWLAGSMFHIGWTGNYVLWKMNPISTIPIAHTVWDPHFPSEVSRTADLSSTYISSVPSYGGLYNWLYAVGFQNEAQIYYLVLALELVALGFLLLGKFHMGKTLDFLHWTFTNAPLSSKGQPFLENTPASGLSMLTSASAYIDSPGLRLNLHISSLCGVSSLLWAGHLVHVAIPSSRGIETPNFYYNSSDPNSGLIQLLAHNSWQSFSTGVDSPNHVFGSAAGSGTSLLTFVGGINPSTGSLYLTDIAHHHIAIGVLLIWAGHLYSSLYTGLGHNLYSIASSSGINLISAYVINSLHLQLSLALLCLSLVTTLVAQQTYSCPAYPYLAYDYVTTLSLFIHHNWIASFLMVGAFSHASLFLLRDYTRRYSSTNSDIVSRLISHKASIISHLSWACLFLGFHTLGLYVHNDCVVAFGQPYKQLLIEPVLAQTASRFMSYATSAYSQSDSLYYNLAHPYYSVDSTALGPGDFLAYHSISLGLHVTTLILLKGALDSQGSFLMPDKAQFGFGFSCDGPSRGGTCDISTWDAFYLAFFWALNSNAWLMFYFHWKHLLLWQGLYPKFEESSTFLNGWFRDYLWFNSSSLIRGYDSAGVNDISVWDWAFLAAHLCWAVGFMFLISWRGYWQELIDVIIYMHLRTPFLYDLWDAKFYTPVALSIVQARFIGLVHFSVGFIVTYAAFVLGSSS